MSHLVSSRADSGSAVPFQLEDPFGHCGGDLVEFLFSVVSGLDPKSAGGAFSESSDAASSWEAAHRLGWFEESSKSQGVGLYPAAQRKAVGGVSAGLRSGAQPGGVSLGSLEES